jgi:hypothetical protein
VQGEVAVNNRVDVKSYTSLHKLVDDMFPPQTYTEQVRILSVTCYEELSGRISLENRDEADNV